MSVNFEQSQLLDLIESELDSESAASLRQQLAAEPEMLALLAQIERDRQMLRAMPEPELPAGLKAQVEGLLARPMLIEPVKPGVYRRQQRRLARQRTLKRLASAAMIALVIAGGIWAMATLLLPMGVRQINRHLTARNTESASPNESAEASAPDDSRLNLPSLPQGVSDDSVIAKSDGNVHHYLPQSVPVANLFSDQALPGSDRSTPAVSAAHKSADGAPVEAKFTLMVATADSAAVERAVAALINGKLAQRAALVRNFNYAEARRLEEEWRLAQGGVRTSDQAPLPTVAKAGSGDMVQPKERSAIPTLAQRVRQRLDQHPARSTPSNSSGAGETSGTIAGSSAVAPTLEQQLEFSSHGATHTVAVPVSELAATLERIDQALNQATALRMFSSESSESSPTIKGDADLSAWVDNAARIRDAIQQLLREHPDTVVLLPVVIAPDHSDGR